MKARQQAAALFDEKDYHIATALAWMFYYLVHKGKREQGALTSPCFFVASNINHPRYILCNLGHDDSREFAGVQLHHVYHPCAVLDPLPL